MSHRLSHYIALYGILSFSILGFLLFSWDKNFQESLIIATALSYASWGTVHHWLHNDMYFEVVVEYIVIAALGCILALTLLL